MTYVAEEARVIEVNAIYANTTEADIEDAANATEATKDSEPDGTQTAGYPWIIVSADNSTLSAKVITKSPEAVGRAYTIRSVGEDIELSFSNTSILAASNYTAVALDIFGGFATVSGTGSLFGETDGTNGWAEGVCCYGGAQVYLNSGVTVIGRATGADSLAYGAKCYNAGRRGTSVIDADVVSSLSVNGASLQGIVTGSGSTAYGIYASGYGHINMTQGSVQAASEADDNNAYGVYADTMGSAYIVSGQISAQNSSTSGGTYTDALFAHNGGTITVVDGEISAESAGGSAWGVFATNHDFEDWIGQLETQIFIYGGSIDVNGQNSVAIEAYNKEPNTAHITVRGAEKTVVNGALRSWESWEGENLQKGLLVLGGYFDDDPSAFVMEAKNSDELPGGKLYTVSQMEQGGFAGYYLVEATVEAEWTKGALDEADAASEHHYAATLADAVNGVTAAMANESADYTIRMLKNVTLTEDLTIDTDQAYFNLDLCGYIIDLNNQTLVITGDESNSIMVYSTGSGMSGLRVQNGTLTIDGGTICTPKNFFATRSVAILAEKDTTVYLNAGKIFAYSGITDAAGVYGAEGAAICLNGTEIYAEASVSESEGIPGNATGIASHGANVVVTGGSIHAISAVTTAAGEQDEQQGTAYSIYNANGSLSISGGQLRGKVYSSDNHRITGGAFSETPEEYLTKDYRVKTQKGVVCCYIVLHIPVLTTQSLTEIDGIVTVEGTPYYLVSNLASGQEYVLAVADGDGSLTVFATQEEDTPSLHWKVSKSSMSGAITFTSQDYNLTCSADGLALSNTSIKFDFKGAKPGAGGERPSFGSGAPKAKSKSGMMGGVWRYDTATCYLSYTAEETTYYLVNLGNGAWGCTTDTAEAASFMLFTNGPVLETAFLTSRNRLVLS